MSGDHRDAAAHPSMQLMQLLWPGALVVQAVHVAAQLSLADLLRDGPKHIDELAVATNTHKTSLERLLRALQSLGIFAADEGGIYRQTPLSDVLRVDSPFSVRPWALMLGAGFIWRPSEALDVTVRTGQPGFDHVYGTGFFRYLAVHRDDADTYNRAMSSLTDSIDGILEAYDFSTFTRLVDVGGGHGALMKRILAAHPHLHGIVQDLQGVADTAPASSQDIANRLQFVSADFFEAVTPGADGYLLTTVIHDWHDDAALTILRNCRRAIRGDGTLLIYDAVLTDTIDAPRAMMDLLMMVLTRGRERTETEFRSLLANAGFSLVRVIPTAAGSILESRPI
jgi:hypothetical protein